jgi:hypothetical protein
MPDKWESPWYGAWDLAFHTIALSLVDFDFAKDQLLLRLRCSSLASNPPYRSRTYFFLFRKLVNGVSGDHSTRDVYPDGTANLPLLAVTETGFAPRAVSVKILARAGHILYRLPLI